MAYDKNDALEILKQEARDEMEEITRTLLAALKLCLTEMQVNGTRGKIGADAFDGARAAIAQAKAAGIGEKG